MVYLFFVSEIIPVMPCPLGSIAKTTKRPEAEKQKNNLQQFANLKWKAREFCKVCLCNHSCFSQEIHNAEAITGKSFSE